MRLVSNLPRAFGAVAAMAALALGAQAQTLGCATGGVGGLIPTTGTGGGTFPGTLPTAPTSSTLIVASLPPGATVVTEVRILGLTHTWIADLQFVLTDPSGGQHNVACRVGGFSCDYGGDYTFIPSCTGGLALPATCSGLTVLTPGSYDQNFGAGTLAWPNGTNGIFNTRLDTIPAATGSWTLTAYDWAGGDIGSFASWDVCFGNPLPPAPPAGAPTLNTPADLATVANPVTLTWNAVACAASYDLDLDGVVTTGILGTSFNAPVLAAGVHTWAVRAVNASGASAFSTSRSFTIPTPPPPSTCVAGGAGGLIPATGTGGTGAVWPTTLPASPFTNTYPVVVPPGASQIVKIDLNFTTQHTWIGDLFIVLTDPTGGQHNVLHRVGSTGNAVGLNCDLNGAYSIYESAGQPWPTTCPGTSDIVNGDYNQNFGAWNSGDLGIFNTALGSIPVASGNWTLTIYDWAGGDSGALGSWQLCFDTGPAGPTAYCTSGTSTNGCLPSISANVQPNLANNAGCVITCANVEGQKLGLFFYGVDNTGFSPVAWGAGTSFLCVKGPTQRTPSASSGGTFGACDGTLSVNWDAFQAANPGSLGNPFSAGDSIFVQTWYRDPPSPKTTNLSDALEMTVQP